MLSYFCSCLLIALVVERIAKPAFAGFHFRVSRAIRQATAGQPIRDVTESGKDSESHLGRLMGRLMPDITLPNQEGTPVTLSSSGRDTLRFGGKHLVIFFFGGPLTPLCAREAQAFRDRHAALSELGAEVVGVSREAMDVLKSFKAKESLPFDILFDEGGKVRDQLGIPRDLFFDGRQTYVISRDGLVQSIYNNQLEPEMHADQALITATELRDADKAAELAQAQALEQEAKAQAQALEQEAKRLAENLAGSWDAAITTVGKVASGRVASVARGTQNLIEEVQEAPVKYGKIVQGRAETIATASEQQIRETASVSQRRLQDARYEMQDRITRNSGIAFQKSARDQILTEAQRANSKAVEARYNFQDWFTQNTGIALQRSAREKIATARNEAKAMVAKARDDTQDWFTQNTGIAVQRPAREHIATNIATVGNGVSRMVANTRDDTQDWFTQNTGTALQMSAREKIIKATTRAKDAVVKARYDTQDWIRQNSGVALQTAAREKIAATGREAQSNVEKLAQDTELSMERGIEQLTMQTQLQVDSVKQGIVETLGMPQDGDVETTNSLSQGQAHSHNKLVREDTKASQAVIPKDEKIQSATSEQSHSVDPAAEQAMLFKREMEKASSKQDRKSVV